MGTSLVDRAATSGPMRVGVIDVGADTLRLLVAAASPDEIATVHRERVRLGLGDHVEATGRLRRAAIEAASRAARKQAATARRLGCSRVEIVVTSPGRQAANAGELVAALAQIRGATTRVLTAEQEGACAYYGALAAISGLPDTVAVCDVGGGSTQIVVGSRDGGPAWARSLDLGSLRVTRRASFADPPTVERIEVALALVRLRFISLTPPLPQAAYATGGSARALASLVGDHLGPEELATALTIAACMPSATGCVSATEIRSRRTQIYRRSSICESQIDGAYVSRQRRVAAPAGT